MNRHRHRHRHHHHHHKPQTQPHRLRHLLPLPLLLLILLPLQARADRPSATGAHYEFAASWVHMEDADDGIEAQFAALFPLLKDHGVDVGPRAGVLRAFHGPDTRTDFSIGGTGLVWIANLAGPGFAADWIVTNQETTTHARLEPYVSLRAFHVLKEGALSLRVGVPYETPYRWGFRAGIALQLDGVPVAPIEGE